MKRYIKRLLVFFAVAILAYPIVVILADQLIPHSWKRNLRYKSKSIIQYKLEDLKDEQDLDILFIGSSHCYRGFDTRIFKEEGLETFNLGSSSQTPKETNLILNKYLPQLRPKLIIYEVFPTFPYTFRKRAFAPHHRLKGPMAQGDNYHGDCRPVC